MNVEFRRFLRRFATFDRIGIHSRGPTSARAIQKSSAVFGMMVIVVDKMRQIFVRSKFETGITRRFKVWLTLTLIFTPNSPLRPVAIMHTSAMMSLLLSFAPVVVNCLPLRTLHSSIYSPENL